MRKLVFIQTAVPDYRKKFFDMLQNKLGSNFILYAGAHYFEKSIKTDQSIAHRALKNNYLLHSKLLVQLGVLKLIMSNDLLVVELNPRILTNWVLLLVRAMINKKTVVWGHAWPRKGQDAKSDFVRNCMRLLATAIVVYTHKQKEELALKMPNKKIYAAPNALFTKSQMLATTIAPCHLIYVGRLTSLKKVRFLVKSFKEILQQLPTQVQLLIVGDGEEKEHLHAYITDHKIGHRVQLLGHIKQYEVLQKFYAQSICSISPGYVGLSITQSFGFGVPMIVSRDENHSPELEAVVEGENAMFYETDSLESFRESVLKLYAQKDMWISKRDVISRRCAQKYSVEAMAQVFYDLLNTYAS